MKKGLIKASLVVFFSLVGFAIIFFSLFSSAAQIDGVYTLKEGIHLTFSQEPTNYTLRIITPSNEELVSKSFGNMIFYSPDKIGTYKLLVYYAGESKKYTFQIVNSKQEYLEQIQKTIWEEKEKISGEENLTELFNVSNKKENFQEEYLIEEKKIDNVKKEISIIHDTNFGSEEIDKTIVTEIEQNIKIGEKEKIKLYWEENNSYIDFEAKDNDNDTYIDEIQWIIPDFIGEQTFEIIIITKAEHLFSNKTFVSDIYEEVRELDNNWSETINSEEYIRITFEKNLTNLNDITIFPRITSGNPTIEVYEKDSSLLIAKFENIISNEYNKVYLTNLTFSQDKFDLKVIGGSLEFDHIIDPTAIYNMNPSFSAYRGQPTSSSRWSAGTNATSTEYSNMNSEDATYAANIMATGTSNDEPFWRFNFTIGTTASSLSSLYVKFTGYENATGLGEAATLYAWRFGNSTWMRLGTLNQGSNGNLTRNFTSDFSNYIDANSQFVLVVEGANFDAGDALVVNHVQLTLQYADIIPPYFTYIPQNLSLFYGNESLGVDFNASDEFQFGEFYTNDSRFLINQEGYLSNATSLGVGNYEINISINDSYNNINWTRYKVQINKSQENCQVLFNETFPLNYKNSFLVWANCTTSFTLLRNDTFVSNNSEQKLGAGVYNFSMFRADTENYTIYYNETQIELTDPIFPLIDFGSITPLNGSKFARTWIFVEASVEEDNEKNITFYLYYSNKTLLNSSTYTDSRRTINWTNLAEGKYYYNITIFDLSNNYNFTETRSITLNFTLPSISFVYPTESTGLAFKRNWIYANVTTSNVNQEINITFGLYNSSGLVNQSIFTDLRRTINWTNLPEEHYYYNVTLFDNPDGIVSTLTRDLILDLTPPNATITSPENNSILSYSSQSFIADITDNLALSNFTLFIYNKTHLINQTEQFLFGTSSSPSISYTFDQEGRFNWVYRVYDLAGNSFETGNFTLVYDLTFPQIQFVSPTENTDTTFSRDWIYANLSVLEENEKNITFSLYGPSGLINETTFTDSRREINWTGLNGGDYYYNVSIYDIGNNLNSTETRHITLDFTTYVLNITNPLISNPLNVSELDNVSLYFNFTGNSVEVTSGVNINSVFIGGVEANVLNVTEQIHLRSNSNGTVSNQTISFSPLENTQYAVLFNSLTDTDTVYSSGEVIDNASKTRGSFSIQMEDDTGVGETANFMWGAIPFGLYTINNTAIIQCGNTSGSDLILGTGGESKRVYLNNSMPNSNYAVTCSVSRDTDTPRCGLDSQVQIKNSTTFGLQINDDGGAGENVTSVDYCAFSFGEYSIPNINFKAGNATIGGSGITNITFETPFPDTAYVVFITHNEDDSGDMCACETTILATNSFTSSCEDDGGATASCVGDPIEWVAFTRGTFDQNYTNENKQLRYAPGQGWEVNVTIPVGFEGLQDLFINATYNLQTKNDTEFAAIRYKDKTPPYFTFIPQNISLFYENESLGVDFDATDAIGFGYFYINDTRFSINQSGYLSNATPLAAGNYEINVSINDSAGNINWTRYRVQINKSNYFTCGVYFNTTSPITYPENFIAYTNCSTAYTLYRNGTAIPNGSVINGGASYYNITVRRTDASNYSNVFSSEFFMVNKNQEKFKVLFNTTSPINYPDTFLVWANSTNQFTLRRNGTIISNYSEQILAAGYYNFSAQRTDTSNFSFNYNQSFFTISKNPENCQVLFNETSPLNSPKTFLVWTNCTTPFNLYRNGTLISNFSEQSLAIGAYNFSMFRTDSQNFSIIFNQTIFRIVELTPPYFTSIPQNASLFYGNESLGVDFDATDETSFGYFRINDTRFLINQTGYLSNATPLAVGNYEINVSINDSSNNINWTKYKIQVNKSNYFTCGVYFNATSPITYPENFIAYTNCSTAYTLYRNGTVISNGSVINGGASYYNITVRRTDTSNYSNVFSSEFFTVNKATSLTAVLTSSAGWNIEYPTSTTISSSESNLGDSDVIYGIYRNNSYRGVGETVSLAVGIYNYTLNTTGGANYTLNNSLDSKLLVINKNTSSECKIYFNTSNSLEYPDTFRVWADCGTAFSLRRNGTIISNNSEQRLGFGFYNFSVLRTDSFNYTNYYNESQFTINKSQENCQILFNETSPMESANPFLVWANCTSPFNLYRNGTLIGNNSVQSLAYGIYNFSMIRLDSFNYSIFYNETFMAITDTVFPLIEFIYPTKENNSNVSQNWIYLNLSVIEANLKNISFNLFYSNYTLRNSIIFTNLTKDINFTLIEEGEYLYNVSIFDIVGNYNSTETRKITLDTTAPKINLLTENLTNFSGTFVDFLNFSVNDTNELTNCTLYGDWGAGWHANETMQNPQKLVNLNFSNKEIINEGHYSWNVQCYDFAGNSAFNSSNFSFSAFYLPDAINPFSIAIFQTKNDGTGEIILNWSSAAHSDYYRIYSTDNLTMPFTLLGQTKETNYTDSLSNSSRRRFYIISNWNPLSENISNVTLGKTVYYLKRKPGANTKNFLGFYLENNLSTANESLNEVSNITSFTMLNTTIQKRVTCNGFSCPTFPSCTVTNCNFDLDDGRGYEATLNTSSSVFTNWSTVGVVKPNITIPLEKNLTSFGKNWVSVYYNNSLKNAVNLISSVQHADAVTNWDEFNQASQGYIVSPFPWTPYVGTNFIIYPEKGYEISVTENSNFTQI